jgi:hypothetical protein
MLDVVFEVVGAILHIVFEAIFCLTGHIVLWALSLGRWNVSNGRDNLAILIGILLASATRAGPKTRNRTAYFMGKRQPQGESFPVLNSDSSRGRL